MLKHYVRYPDLGKRIMVCFTPTVSIYIPRKIDAGENESPVVRQFIHLMMQLMSINHQNAINTIYMVPVNVIFF